VPKSPTKRRPVTVASLLDGALEVFAERGFHGASIGDICERAGLTRGAFYSNFRDKQHLFFALYDRRTAHTLAFLRGVFEVAQRAADPIAVAAERLADHRDQDKQWFLIAQEFTLFAIRNPRAAVELAEHEAREQAGLAELIGELLAAAGREPTLPLLDLARLFAAVRRGAGAELYTRPAPDADLEQRMMPILLRSLSAPLPEGKAVS
jgi:AcrR family transcriptional regulator